MSRYNNQGGWIGNTIKTYTQALDKLDNPRTQDTKIVANNTKLVRHDDYIGVKLHNTEVVHMHKSGTFSLYTGGWYTVTTKARINDFSPARVTQKNSVWYVGKSLFYEGMAVNSEGEPIMPKLEDQDILKHNKKIKKSIKKYADNVASMIENKKLDRPSSGDCWFCAMHTVDNNQPLGDATENTSHLLSHLEENYIVPSLVYNAIVEAGYSMPGYIYQSYPEGASRAVYKYLSNRLVKQGASNE